MIIEKIGEVAEQADGRLLIQFWVISGCDVLTDAEVPELIRVAKEHGTYKEYPRLSIEDLQKLYPIRGKYENL